MRKQRIIAATVFFLSLTGLVFLSPQLEVEEATPAKEPDEFEMEDSERIPPSKSTQVDTIMIHFQRHSEGNS